MMVISTPNRKDVSDMNNVDEMVVVNGVRYRPEDAPKRVTRKVVEEEPEEPETEEVEETEEDETEEVEDDEPETKARTAAANKARRTRNK